MNSSKNTQKGFTLIEVTIVVLAGGLFLTAGMALLKSFTQQAQVQATQARMQAIENAINSFNNNNNRLPCAAALDDAVDGLTFGLETTQSIGVDCPLVTNASVPGGVFKATGSAGSPVIIGAVPVRSLNLPDQDMVDGWNNRFIYAVTANMASVTPTVTGEIAVSDGAGNPVALPAGSAQYVVISLGPDRVGAYTLDGAAGTACAAGTTETPNCTFGPGAATFVKTSLENTAGGAGQYDDYVDFYTQQMNTGVVPSGTIMSYDGSICPPGWLAPASPAGGALPNFVPGPLDTPSYAGPWPVVWCEKQ